ncbi:CBS domain-containing protein [Streptomyces sp. NBC_01538]|uniref:CBS domain-containing protein n=1 Tax=Streptomyces sp. NBC_01538 TaxID=2903897 RepID=UPI003869389A
MTDDLAARPTVHALLADGTTGCVRSALSDDPDQLQGFYEELSPDNLRSRFADINPALARTEGATVHADDTIVQAARTMAQRHVERLPVLDEEDRLVGIVTRRDLLQVFLRPDQEIRTEVIQEVLLHALWLPPGSVEVSVTEGVVTLTGHMERKSETEIAVAMTRRIDGVVDVVGHLTYRLDDARLRTEEAARAMHGVADDWLRRL